MPDRRRAHGCPGATTTVSVSDPARRPASPGGRSGPSTNPMSAAPPRTAAATSAELPAASVTAVSGWRPRSAVSQPGSRYSATVIDAATRSIASLRCRSEVIPASSAAAASTAACAQPATSSPCAVSREPEAAQPGYGEQQGEGHQVGHPSSQGGSQGAGGHGGREPPVREGSPPL